MGVSITISSNTTVTPLYANGAVLANVEAGTIHLANATSKMSLAISSNTAITPLYANGAPLANVEAGTIHLANAALKMSLAMPTKVVRRVNDFEDVNTDSIIDGQVIRYVSANDTFIASSRASGGNF
jgi:hypothetical protein